MLNGTDGLYIAQYPHPPDAQARTHAANWVNPCYAEYSSGAGLAAQRYQIESDWYEGVEAWDYQNPYVWMGRQLIQAPTLDPHTFGAFVVNPEAIAANVRAHPHDLLV